MVAAALPILQSLPEGSSGTGISYYSQAVRCSRKSNLDARVEGFSSSGKAANVGKIFHALCEIYFKTGRSDIVVELADVNLGEAADEARRLFDEYSRRFQPSDFAQVIGCELLLPGDQKTTPVVQHAELARRTALIAEALGVSPFTCRLDMVVEIDAKSSELLYKKRQLILEPGVYLWDFKTKGQKSSSLELEYRHSPQFVAYQVVWNALFPDTPCKGMIADVIVGHKTLVDGSFFSILVPSPSDEQAAGLRRWLQFAKKQASLDEPNWLACFEFGRACPHLNGMCNRA